MEEFEIVEDRQWLTQQPGWGTAAVGGAYQFAKTATANLREKDDLWNTVSGGFFGGAMLGLRGMPLPITPCPQNHRNQSYSPSPELIQC